MYFRDSRLLRGEPARLPRSSRGYLCNTEPVEFIAPHWTDLERLLEDAPAALSSVYSVHLSDGGPGGISAKLSPLAAMVNCRRASGPLASGSGLR